MAGKNQFSTDNKPVPQELLWLSHELGSPNRSWAVLGEGNASCHCDSDSFFVKASGTQLRMLTEDQVVRVDKSKIMTALCDSRPMSDLEIKELLNGATLSPKNIVPSVETLLHAYLLSLPNVTFVGHTHITPIISIVSTRKGWDYLCSGRRLFPDEIVVCGIAPCCVPYADPGLPLARQLVKSVEAFVQTYATHPKTIYLQNHGVIALGASAAEVLNVSVMAEKGAQVLLGALSIGSVQPLTSEQSWRIAERPDEHHRQKMLGLT